MRGGGDGSSLFEASCTVPDGHVRLHRRWRQRSSRVRFDRRVSGNCFGIICWSSHRGCARRGRRQSPSCTVPDGRVRLHRRWRQRPSRVRFDRRVSGRGYAYGICSQLVTPRVCKAGTTVVPRLHRPGRTRAFSSALAAAVTTRSIRSTCVRPRLRHLQFVTPRVCEAGTTAVPWLHRPGRSRSGIRMMLEDGRAFRAVLLSRRSAFAFRAHSAGQQRQRRWPAREVPRLPRRTRRSRWRSGVAS